MADVEAIGSGTAHDPWVLKTPPGTSDYTMYRDASADSPALVCIVGTFLISYTRARAEALGIDAKVGMMQRPERIILLSAPQALFGLFWNGWVLMAIIVLLTVTAWITAIQRIAFVYRATLERDSNPIRMVSDQPSPPKTASIPATRRAQL